MLGEKHTHKRIRRNIPGIHKDYDQCLLLSATLENSYFKDWTDYAGRPYKNNGA